MPSSRKISKAEKSLVLVCVFAVLPLAGAVYLVAGRDADAQWNIANTATRPILNGYDFYVAAAKATVRFKPEVDPVADTTTNLPNSPYARKNYSLVRRQKWLKANEGTFAMVNKGLKTPSMAPVFDSSKPAGDWAILRQLGRDVGARTRTFQMEKQPMRATMSALDGMQMGQDTSREGGLVARVVGVAIMALGRDPLEDWDKTINSLNSNEACTATRRLEVMLAREPSAAQTLTVDKRDSLIELRRIFAIDGWRKKTASANSSDLKDVPRLWQSQTASKRAIYDEVNRALDARIACAKLPYSQSRTANLPDEISIFAPSLMLIQNRFLMMEARATTSNDMLLLRLALRAYIVEHGVAPAKLSALVPGYLKHIPADVYSDGKPLFYTPQGGTYKLWSVGPDGVNDGGVPLTRRSNSDMSRPSQNLLDNTGDFVAGLCR